MTVRKMMIAVALIGVALAAFRVHFSVGSFVAGALSIGWIETAKQIKRRETAGARVRILAMIGLFGSSAAIASGMIAGSMIPVVLLSPFFWPQPSVCRANNSFEILYFTSPLWVYATVRVANILKRWFFGLEQVSKKTASEPLEATIRVDGKNYLDDRRIAPLNGGRPA